MNQICEEHGHAENKDDTSNTCQRCGDPIVPKGKAFWPERGIPKPDIREAIAKLLWTRDYPKGGSVYPTYESTSQHDKDLYMKEATEFITALGEAMIK